MGYIKGRSRTIIFMLLLAFLHSWMQSSKVATVPALQNSLPMFPCIASAATNEWPFPRYLIVVVSVSMYLHIVLLRLSGLRQMRFSLNWRINCRHAYAKAGALRPSNCFMSKNTVIWFTRSVWRECIIESNQTAYK